MTKSNEQPPMHELEFPGYSFTVDQELEEPTERERQLLKLVDGRIFERLGSPTLDELREELNLKSNSTVHEHVENLIKKGWLDKQPRAHRGIRLTAKAGVALGVESIANELSELPEPYEQAMREVLDETQHLGLRFQLHLVDRFRRSLLDNRMNFGWSDQ